MKNCFKFFFLAFVITFLAGCAITPIKNKIIEKPREIASTKLATSTEEIVPKEKVAEQQKISQSKIATSTLDLVIAAMNGKRLKDFYREMSSSSPNVDWGAFGEVKEKGDAPLNSSKVDWHAIGFLLLFYGNNGCENESVLAYKNFDSKEYLDGSPLVSVGDTKEDFNNNISASLALKKYEKCILGYFKSAQEIGLPARAAFYEQLASTLGAEFTVGAAALYNISEHRDWCDNQEWSEEKRDYCLNLKEEDVIPKMRKYYQITDAVAELKKQLAELTKETGTTSTSIYDDEEDSDEYAKKKIAIMGGFIRTERAIMGAMEKIRYLKEAPYREEYENQPVRITVILLREDMGEMGILDDIYEE